jgi:hypothetical protein
MGGIGKFDTINFPRNFFAPPILINHGSGSFYIDMIHFCCRQTLPVAVLEDDHKGIVILGGRGSSQRDHDGKQQYPGNCHDSNEPAHDDLLTTPP